MAVGSGLGSSFGFVNESIYGTYVAPTKFLPVKSFQLNRVAGRVQGEGLRNGSFGPLTTHYAEATQAGSGQVVLDVQAKTMGKLFEALMGASTSSQLGATTSYTQTFTLADTLGKYLTVQGGVPRRAGTVVVHTLTGTKVTGAQFSCEAGGLLQGTFTFDAQKWSDAQSLATVSYAADTQPPFHGGQMTVKLGTYSSEAAVSGVRSYSLTINRPMDTEDYTAGASGLKSEPVLNGWADINGSLTVDFLDKAILQDVANATTAKSLVIEHVGALIVSTGYYTLRFTIPGIKLEQSTQNVEGVGELTNAWNFTWAYDGTNQPKIEYITTDTTI